MRRLLVLLSLAAFFVAGSGVKAWPAQPESFGQKCFNYTFQSTKTDTKCIGIYRIVDGGEIWHQVQLDLNPGPYYDGKQTWVYQTCVYRDSVAIACQSGPGKWLVDPPETVYFGAYDVLCDGRLHQYHAWADIKLMGQDGFITGHKYPTSLNFWDNCQYAGASKVRSANKASDDA